MEPVLSMCTRHSAQFKASKRQEARHKCVRVQQSGRIPCFTMRTNFRFNVLINSAAHAQDLRRSWPRCIRYPVVNLMSACPFWISIRGCADVVKTLIVECATEPIVTCSGASTRAARVANPAPLVRVLSHRAADTPVAISPCCWHPTARCDTTAAA